MAHNFLDCDREQDFLMPPSLRDWLPEGHLAWFVLDAVEQLDLAPFHASYRADGWGRAAHDPAMMVALMLYAYAVGERSARGIERRCHEDVAFRVIAANRTPDHATVARFRVRHEDALAALFGSVLGLCAQAGLVSVGVIALDSTKVEANASGRANLDHEAIARELLADAAATDAAEDARFGAARGDELPPELADPVTRKQRLRAARRALAARRAARAEAVPAGRPERLAEAKRRLAEDERAERRAEQAHATWRAERAAARAAAGRAMTGRPPAPARAPARAAKVNVTDPDSRPVKCPRGFIQGYSAHAVTGAGQIVIAADVVVGSPDGGLLAPLVEAALSELRDAGVDASPAVCLADAGYWKADQIEALEAGGLEVLCPPDAHSSPGCGPKRSPAAQRMRATLSGTRARALYRLRQHMIEPVFAHTKVVRRGGRFSRRGLSACRSEWRFDAATHNLLKLWRYGGGPAGASRAAASA
jgi:transposase